MTYYWRIFWQQLKISLADTLAYRADILSSVLLGIVWTIISIALVEVIFLHTDSFAGWSKPQIILLLLTFQLSTEFLASFGNAIYQFANHIRTGSFDLFLVRPVDAQFLSIFGRPDLKNLFTVFTNIIPYLYLLSKNPVSVTLPDVIIYVYLVFLANILWLGMKTVVVTCNFWWQKLDNITYLLYNMVSLGKYPVTIFPKKLQVIFHTFFPIAFIAVIPTQALQGTMPLSYIFLATLITLFVVILSRLFWQFAITHYSSASS